MNQKRVKALKAELIEILGISPTQTQWRVWKKRRQVLKMPLSFFKKPESEMTIEYAEDTPKKQSWLDKLKFLLYKLKFWQ